MTAETKTEEIPAHGQAGLVMVPGMFAIGLWFASDRDNHDLLASVHKMEGEDEWILKLRLRTVVDPEPFTEKDRKVWWVGKVHGKSQREMYNHVQEMMEGAVRHLGMDVGELKFQPIYEDMIEWFTRRRKNKTLPEWMHVREERLH